MPISRVANTPRFIEYVTRYALIDTTITTLPTTLHSFGLKTMRVPPFQRGIAWASEQVFDFLNSTSAALGHIILAYVDHKEHLELIDGLQRFATGTALFNSILSITSDTTESKYQEFGAELSDLFLHGKTSAPVLQHNHKLLLNHSRDAIKHQYQIFFDDLNDALRQKVKNANTTEIKKLSDCINALFLHRYIAIDEFSGFAKLTDAISTFIGINTIRVELGTVDLLRTLIIDHAERHSWSSVDIEKAENHITDTFVENGLPKKESLPIATVCLEILENGNPEKLLENWSTGSDIYELDVLLQFIDAAISCIPKNSYVTEIAESGTLPFSILVLHYYSVYIKTNNNPPYVNGNNSDDAALHQFLRSTYRVLLSGSIGQLGPIAGAAANGDFATLSDAANLINDQFTTAGPLHTAPPDAWIRAQLLKANSEKAKRIFNACLLPIHTAQQTTTGTFTPLNFSGGLSDWHIDRLIPTRSLNQVTPGYQEGRRITNFSPLMNCFNKDERNKKCSEKLSSSGIYTTQTQTSPIQHPYVDWLISTAPSLNVNLDNQVLLQPNTTPNVGDQRIEKIADLLGKRI
jgi:hypothetical protein